MKLLRYVLITLGVIFIPIFAHAATITDKIITCGHDTVAIYDVSSGTPTAVWTYVAPTNVGYTSCHMFNNNASILLSSAFSGVDIMDVASKTVTSHWDAICAHDAKWLTSTRILAAVSTCTYNGTTYGGSIKVFDATTSNSPALTSTAWGGSHSLILNNDRDNTFWVTNHPYLSKMSIINASTSSPIIAINKKFTIPASDSEVDNHALTISLDGSTLVFSSGDNIYDFNISTHVITQHFSTAQPGAKSFDYNTNTKLLMYVLNDSTTDNTVQSINFDDGSTISIPNSYIYRAFWVYGSLPT